MVKSFGQCLEVDWIRGSRSLLPSRQRSNITELKVLNMGLAHLSSISRLVFCIHTLIILKLRQPEIIFTRDFAFIYFYSKLPSRLRTKSKVVFEAHKIYSEVSDKVNLRQEISAYGVVDQFVCVSGGIKEDLVSIFNITESNILNIANGVEERKTDLQISPSSKPIKFIYAGSYSKWKGVDTILEASLLLEDFRGHIYIVGVDLEVPSYAKAYVTVLPPMEREDLYHLYSTMDVGLVPTLDHQEGTKYTSPIKLMSMLMLD